MLYEVITEEVKVTPGIKTVNSEKSVGATKNFETLSNKNQKAKPIITKPAITLVSAKILIPLLVLPRILVKTD